MSSSVSPAPAPSSSEGRGRFFSALREFWIGLTTPDIRAVAGAAGVIAVALLFASLLAREDRVARGASADWLDPVYEDHARSSFYAMQGAARQASGPGPTAVFVGPSALRFWLPPPEETNAVFRSTLGPSARALILCGDSQSYATSAALIERFGWDFEGVVVVAVDRNMIAREVDADGRMNRLRQSRQLGFVSERLFAEAAALGQPMETGLGWSFWDRRSFHFHSYLGMGAWLPARLRPRHQPHWERRGELNLAEARGHFGALAPVLLDRHLALLDRLAADARRAGRARLVLVETPWLDQYEASVRPPAWAEDEAEYAARREDWMLETGVEWWRFAEDYSVKRDDFVDPRHIGSPGLRRRFAAEVARALRKEPAP
jgi:hypothetical protein